MKTTFSLPLVRIASHTAWLAAAVLLVLTTWRALHVDPLPTPRGTALAVTAGSSRPATSDPAPSLENDPFDPARAPIGTRPALANAVAAPEADADATVVQVLGTVVIGAHGGFAICQLPSELPRTVHVGESIGALTLERVAAGRVVFRTSTGERLELTVDKPES